MRKVKLPTFVMRIISLSMILSFLLLLSTPLPIWTMVILRDECNINAAATATSTNTLDADTSIVNVDACQVDYRVPFTNLKLSGSQEDANMDIVLALQSAEQYSKRTKRNVTDLFRFDEQGNAYYLGRNIRPGETVLVQLVLGGTSRSMPCLKLVSTVNVHLTCVTTAEAAAPATTNENNQQVMTEEKLVVVSTEEPTTTTTTTTTTATPATSSEVSVSIDIEPASTEHRNNAEKPQEEGDIITSPSTEEEQHSWDASQIPKRTYMVPYLTTPSSQYTYLATASSPSSLSGWSIQDLWDAAGMAKEAFLYAYDNYGQPTPSKPRRRQATTPEPWYLKRQKFEPIS